MLTNAFMQCNAVKYLYLLLHCVWYKQISMCKIKVKHIKICTAVYSYWGPNYYLGVKIFCWDDIKKIEKDIFYLKWPALHICNEMKAFIQFSLKSHCNLILQRAENILPKSENCNFYFFRVSGGARAEGLLWGVESSRFLPETWKLMELLALKVRMVLRLKMPENKSAEEVALEGVFTSK